MKRFHPGDAAASLRFLLWLAALGVLARFVLMDQIFFRLLRAPSHDFVHGLAFFTTSMHAVYLSGDLAWWWPGSVTGYAQYYLGLFSPVAPTWGHIVFIAWAHMIGLLATLGVHLPEYYQYLVVNYVVLPFFAFAAFGYFCAQVLRRRESIALAMTAYVLSGIGLWNSAWFYFQEAGSLFFFLGSTLALLRRPSPARLLVWLAAVLIQFASINYWTVYNLFFAAIVLGLYAATHPNQVVRLWIRLRAWAALDRRATFALCAAVLTVFVAWSALIAAAMADQAGYQERAIYTAEDALGRIQEARTFTTELFNPSLERALQRHPQVTEVVGKPVTNAVHSARYVGVLLLPLALLALFVPWPRRVRWLLGSALLVLTVCLGAPFAVALWAVIPFMDRVHHLFYFYSQYWQVLVVLLAAVGMDRLLAGPAPRTRAVLRWVVAFCLGASALVLIGAAASHERYLGGDAALQANVRASLMLGIAGVLLFRWLRDIPARHGHFLAVAFLLALFLDLSQYFYVGARADIEFSLQKGWRGTVPSQAERARLRAPWPEPDPRRGFSAGLDQAMPIQSGFWPVNIHAFSGGMTFEKLQPIWDHVYRAEPFLFFDGAIVARQDTVPQLSSEEVVGMDSQLLVEAVHGSNAASATSTRVTEGFEYEWKKWGYTEYSVDVVAPRDGWLLIRQLHDPSWRLTVDGLPVQGTKANYIGTALPLTAGKHQVRGEYRPLPRRMYWWAAAALEIVVTVLLVLGWRMRGAPRPRSAQGVVSLRGPASPAH